MKLGAGTLLTPHAGDNRSVTRVVCAGVAVLAIAAGVIHVSAAAEHENLPVMMVGFLVVATLQVGLGGLLIWRRPSRLLLAAAAALMVGSVAMWVVSRTAGLPFLPGGHMEPIGWKDATTVLFEIAALPGLLLLLSRDLDSVTLPSARLGSQALGGLAVGTFMLFTPALVMSGGEHHSADQHAAMEGHGHADQASAERAGAGHGHSGGSGHAASKGHRGDGGHGGMAGDGGGSGGHGDHGGSAGDDLASASPGGRGSAHGGSHGNSGGRAGTRGGDGHQGGSHGGHGGGRDTDRRGRGDGHRDGHGDQGGSGGGREGGGHGGSGGGGHGDSHPPAEAAHGDDHAGEGAEDGYTGPDGRLTWGPHSLDFEPARPAREGKAGTSNSFVYRGPPDPDQDTRGHDHSGEPCNPTAAQRAAADKLYRETASELRKYRNNPARAAADGFVYAFPVTDRITHMVNVGRVYDPTILDAGEIESFLYVMTDDGLMPVGGMYIMPRPFEEGPKIGGCLTKWHRHSGLAGRAVSAGMMEDTPDMLHVYTYPGLEPYGHYDGRTLASFWTPGALIPNICRETGDSSDVCLP